MYESGSKPVLHEHIVGTTDNPSYVGHGHITDVSNVTCFDSELKDTYEDYFYSEGTLYDGDVDRELLSNPVSLSVGHNKLQDDPSKMVTTISSSEKERDELKAMGIAVPVVLECELSEKIIYNLQRANVVAVVPVKDICPHGELILPSNNYSPIEINNYVNYSVTTSDDGSLWVVMGH